jgi:hypothetical protein
MRDPNGLTDRYGTPHCLRPVEVSAQGRSGIHCRCACPGPLLIAAVVLAGLLSTVVWAGFSAEDVSRWPARERGKDHPPRPASGEATLPTGSDVPSGVNGGTWSLTPVGDELQIAYGSGSDFPQYAALHLVDSYFRLNYGPASGWGTSVVLLPAFWGEGTYYQGAPVTNTWQVAGSDLVLDITGTIATLDVHTEVVLSPPSGNTLEARVATTVEGTLSLDDRPGESFKPVVLSSMHISSAVWDAQMAFAACQTLPIPETGWIGQPEPAILARTLGLLGGTSDWKENAPAIRIELDRALQVVGWVTLSSDPNDDNVGLWAATSEVLSSWSYRVVASPAEDVQCLFLPAVLTGQ